MATNWQEIIYRSVESEELDYKAAVDWRRLSRSGKSKFARHCMALANTKGGFIVVGVGEDASGKPALFTGVTEAQAASFDPTMVGNFINQHADPAVDFTIERPVVDTRQYVVFIVRRFADIPHVCSCGCDSELQQGVFYIRTAEASSRPAYRANEVHNIVQRALRNQREALGRMLRGILYEKDQHVSDASAMSMFAEQLQHSYNFFNRKNPEADKHSIFEYSVRTDKFNEDRFSLSEVKRTIEHIIEHNQHSVFIRPQEGQKGYFSNVAFRAFAENGARLWQAFASGLFHYLYSFDRNREMSIDYNFLVAMVTECVCFTGEYYTILGCDDELLQLEFTVHNTDKLQLVNSPPQMTKLGKNLKYVCHIPQISIRLRRTAADLVSGTGEHAETLIRGICERFNLTDSKHNELKQIIGHYLSARGENI